VLIPAPARVHAPVPVAEEQAVPQKISTTLILSWKCSKRKRKPGVTKADKNMKTAFPIGNAV
jgi:hypothetical protein